MASPITGRRGLRSQGRVKDGNGEEEQEMLKTLEDDKSGSENEVDSPRPRRKSPHGKKTDDDSSRQRRRSPHGKKRDTGNEASPQSVRKEREVKSKMQSRQKTTKSTSTFSFNHICVYCVVVAIGVLAVYVLLPAKSQEVQTPKERQKLFLDKLKELKDKFPNQSDRFWNIIAAAPMGHLKSSGGDGYPDGYRDSSPDRPVVVMLAGQPGTGPTTECIASHLGRLYTIGLSGSEHPIQPVCVNGSDYVNLSPDSTKRKIDGAFQSGFRSNSKAAVVHQFDKLPSCSALLFHSYCENDNAPFTDIAIILTLELDSHVFTIRKEADRMVNEHLGRCWSSCAEFEEKGKVEAMLSRVANNIALVTKENGLEQC